MDIMAAKMKGLTPTFAMSWNLTLEPTPEKDIANRKGIILDFNVACIQIQVSPRTGILTVNSFNPAQSREFSKNNIANRGTDNLDSTLFFLESNLFKKNIDANTIGAIMNILMDLMIRAGCRQSGLNVQAAAITWADSCTPDPTHIAYTFRLP